MSDNKIGQSAPTSAEEAAILPRKSKTGLALEILEKQEKAYSSRGKVAEYAKMLLEDLPNLVERPRVLDRAVKLIIRSGLRRSALESIEAMEFEGKQGLAAYIASHLPGQQELNQRTGDVSDSKRKSAAVPRDGGAKSGRRNQAVAG